MGCLCSEAKMQALGDVWEVVEFGLRARFVFGRLVVGQHRIFGDKRSDMPISFQELTENSATQGKERRV